MKTLPLALLTLFACTPSSETSDAGTQDSPANDTSTLAFSITNVTGTYGGSDVSAQSATDTETMDMMTCTTSSTGTTADQAPYIVDPAKSAGFPTYVGFGIDDSCPAGSATSTVNGTCSIAAFGAKNLPYSLTLVASGWEDSSTVTITSTSGGPPGAVTEGCNYASVIQDVGHPWNIVGTTTVGMFRGTAPFDVRFQGTQTLTELVDTSSVSWDFTITFHPAPQ